jgi:serine acetyltransferase
MTNIYLKKDAARKQYAKTQKRGILRGRTPAVLINVVLGENSVIGGGSVVTKDVSPGKVLVGFQKEIMEIEEYNAKREAFMKAKQKR